MSQTAPKAFLNGKIIPAAAAKISAGDHGFLYGEGLFETVKVRNAAAVFLENHLQRLTFGAAVLKMELPEAAQLKQAVGMIIDANKLRDGYLRLTVSRGEGSYSWQPESCRTSTVLIVCHFGSSYTPEQYEEGLSVKTISFPRNQHSPLTKIKSLNYAENILGKLEARSAGAQEGLFLNTASQVAECCMSNIFLVRNKIVVTPDDSSGLLPGIIRAKILEICAKAAIKAEIAAVYPKELQQCDEIFLTNSLMGIMPLSSLDGRGIVPQVPGPITLELSGLLAKLEQES